MQINIPAHRGARASREQCPRRSLIPRHQQTMLGAVPWQLGPLSTSLPRFPTSIRPDGSWVNLISSSSQYLARLSAKAKWFLESPGSKGPVAPIHQGKLETEVNKPAGCTKAKAACDQVATNALVPWSLGIKLGLMPWSPGSLAARSQGSKGPWWLVTLDHLGNWVPWFLDRRMTQVLPPT